MIELIGIFAAFGWLVLWCVQWLHGLPFFWTLVLGSVVAAGVARLEISRLAAKHGFPDMHSHRRPVPPERFFWPVVRRSVGWRALVFSSGALPFWLAACVWPAAFDLGVGSVAGWIAGALASVWTGRGCGAMVLYFRASQWFDAMAPSIVGLCRRALYRVSDNPEHLGEPEPKREMKTIY